MRQARKLSIVVAAAVTSGCAVQVAEQPHIPALDYVSQLRQAHNVQPQVKNDTYPRARYADGMIDQEILQVQEIPGEAREKPQGGYPRYRSALALGNPGAGASLFQEGRGTNDLFHDHRAFQVMDLVTIVVTENTEGSKEADTKLDSSSTVQAAISKFFGLEQDASTKNPGLDPTALLNASASKEFEGTGETSRKGKLKGTISAMVAEVLPTGILRVAGEKIISVNGEEQVMILSGLVRPRDVTSDNQVDSSKIANMRIDYFGKGDIGDMQRPGWLGRILHKVWPF